MENESNPEGSIEAIKAQGNAAMQGGRYEEAMLHYTHAIRLDPENYALYSNRSFALLRLQQYSLAMEDAVRTIHLNPKWAKGYFRRGEVEYATGNHAEALVSYECALRQQQTDESATASTTTGLVECIDKARRGMRQTERADRQVPWVGAGVGIVVGVVILIADYALSVVPTHPMIMAFMTIGVSLVGFIIAKYLRMQQAGRNRARISTTVLDEEEADEEDDNEDEKAAENGKTRARYTKSQARQRFRKGKQQ